MKKNIVNIFIGSILIIAGIKLHDLVQIFWKYIGVLFIVYGIFVILIKSIKIISHSENKYRQLDIFEKNNNRIIPDFIRKIFEVQLKNNKKIEFEMPHYGTFQIIDYNQKGGDLADPDYIVKEINEFIQRYFFPVLNYSKVIPFATSCNFIYLFVEEGKNDIVLIDLDSADRRPLVLSNKIDNYININKLELRNGIYYYNGLKKIEEIADVHSYFLDIPDCIFEAKDYFEIYSKSFDLIRIKFDFSFLSILETEENYMLTLNIEGQSKEIKLLKFGDFIDTENFIQSLNEILILLNYNQKKYYLISNSICDFGVVLADKKTYQCLSENGCIEISEEKLKLNSEEVNAIRKYGDLLTEINNIEFHLSLIKKQNKLEESLVYDFFYETAYEFGNEDIKELNHQLKVHLKKVDSGYSIYFTS